MNENRFYVYVHTCKETGEVRYIGKGTDGRYKHKSNRTKEHREIWDSLHKKILINNLSSDNASDIEHKLINDAIALGKNLLNKVTAKSDYKVIDFDEMSKLFEYSEDSPSCLITKVDRKQGPKAGEPVGYISNTGYWLVKHKGKHLAIHRIVFTLVHRVELTKGMVIDHIDSNRANNKISNLQQTTRSENNKKASENTRNTSGVKGVSWHKGSKTWVAFWEVDRKLQTKAFSPKKYPNLEYDAAKQMAFKDAVEHRKKMIELHYGQSSQIGEIP